MIGVDEKKLFIEVGHYESFKYKHLVSGDNLITQKLNKGDRLVAVLSDGLGSGIKANVLSTITTVMAFNFVANYKNIRRSAEIIMATLPICKVRKINYATFTIVDIDENRNVRIIEYENPPIIFIRGNKIVNPKRIPVNIQSSQYKDNVLQYSRFSLDPEDRIIFFSDGVTQAGMGESTTPFGWGIDGVRQFIQKIISEECFISARKLARKIVNKAREMDHFKSKDDTTCGVIYLRKPRELLVVTGPPVSLNKDSYLGAIIKNFRGKKVICGGTTAQIIARELGKKVIVDINEIDPEIPPCSLMEGIDLITEGTITINKVVEILEMGIQNNRINGATKLARLLMNSDIIYFVVGTKINQAHQSPNLPVELEIRRNLIKRMSNILEKKYVKEIHLKFI